jgi:hypothetical protein
MLLSALVATLALRVTAVAGVAIVDITLKVTNVAHKALERTSAWATARNVSN